MRGARSEARVDSADRRGGPAGVGGSAGEVSDERLRKRKGAAPPAPRRGRKWMSRVARSTSSSRMRTSAGPVSEARTATLPVGRVVSLGESHSGRGTQRRMEDGPKANWAEPSALERRPCERAKGRSASVERCVRSMWCTRRGLWVTRRWVEGSDAEVLFLGLSCSTLLLVVVSSLSPSQTLAHPHTPCPPTRTKPTRSQRRSTSRSRPVSPPGGGLPLSSRHLPHLS